MAGVYCPATQGECDRDDCIGALCTRITPRAVADRQQEEARRALLRKIPDHLLIEELRRRLGK